ncbi:MBL fold metallo-hydrolase [Allopusillimonas soli]|uniref:MBL fold metallo-hydrolase n=1 Tax=Allopusillimonas soli TaxID=659016 RepID=A0A853FG13_9BURK|nr:MBL fold metallo-hydrolase [Allopusillimonas soli]NYT38598.1 MBL fold metallo-hydrolase [Allopusillimonas soli]TEA71688.1 MBL fold metallo-hydrolase [Allopusillimonas soli]
MQCPTLFRRNPGRLLCTAALCLSGLALSAWTPSALAQAPAQQKIQVPGYYRMMLGDLEVTALYDGYVPVSSSLLKGASAQDIQNLLNGMFVPMRNKGAQTAVNGFLINTGSHLILVDAGAASCFGPTLGALPRNLEAAGYEPAQVDTILLTHLHGDHACGITTAEGKAAFPNATVHVSDDEAAYWLDENVAAKAPEDKKGGFVLAQKAVAPYKTSGRLALFTPGDEVAPGVKSWPLPGHTPGHGGYLIGTGNDQLLFWGDVIHSHAVQFSHPEVAIEFDVDPAKAIVSRKEVLADAVADKLWIAGAHLPFPGIGHVRKTDQGYDWVPLEYTPL